MRHHFILAAAVVVGLLASAGVSPAASQCATGCSSSAACDGTGKGSCFVLCDGGLCNCTDTKCKTEPLPPPEIAHSRALLWFAAAPGVAEAAGPGIVPLTVELMVDCGGNVVDVRLTHPAGTEVFQELSLIAFSPPGVRKEYRFAARD